MKSSNASGLLLFLLASTGLVAACQAPVAEDGATSATTTGPIAEQVAEGGAADVVEATAQVPSTLFAKDGFVVYETDGRLWIFREDSADLQEFLSIGEPAKHVIKIAAGPGGRTVKAPDTDTILAYLGARDGFVTRVVDGRIWVFAEGDAESLADFERQGEPAKHIIRPSAGPLGATIKAVDAATADAYQFAKPGFTVLPDADGRLWVFRSGSDALAEVLANGEPAKHVIRPAAGPRGRTLKAVDQDVIAAYMAACDGFETMIEDGRIWVFLPGSEALEQYRSVGEPAKSVTLVGAGPLGMTVRAVDREVANAYLRTVNS